MILRIEIPQELIRQDAEIVIKVNNRNNALGYVIENGSEHALMIVKCYKEAILPLLANAKVYLYGSCSRNEARNDSDIDVAVVIPKLNGDWLDTTSSLWLATLNIDTSIEPVLIEECKPSPLYDDIMRNGIAV
jgi:hypothetical protein